MRDGASPARRRDRGTTPTGPLPRRRACTGPADRHTRPMTGSEDDAAAAQGGRLRRRRAQRIARHLGLGVGAAAVAYALFAGLQAMMAGLPDGMAAGVWVAAVAVLLAGS